MKSETTQTAPAASGPEAPAGPDERATTFQPVQGGQEHYSGEVLLVTAYAGLWLIIFVWVAMVWRKQAALGSRLTDLERVIDDAARRRDAAGSAGK
jgi:hypothetical protein